MPQASFSELINGDKPTFVDFSAEWCGPCKMMAPILAQLKSEGGDMVRIIKIDVDKNPQTASAYQIQSVPTLMLFKGGNVVWRQSGVVPTEQLKRTVLQFISFNSKTTYHKTISDLQRFRYIQYRPSFHPHEGSIICMI